MPHPPSAQPESHGGGELRAAARERRLRLAEVVRRQRDEFTCLAEVVLETPDGSRSSGSAELPFNEQNYLRVVAQATLLALANVLGEHRLRLVGLRWLRIFDTRVVAVQVAFQEHEAHERLLLGIAVASDDSAAGAARAVLHATNRLIGNIVDR
ncbi:MAG: hypothetical protein ABR599_11965 [Gemmatimonadota bacterium]